MSFAELTTILFTNEHLLKADVATHGLRLLDVLNEPDKDFLQICNVEVFRRGGGAATATLSQLLVSKAHVGLAVPLSDKHEAPQKRINTFVAKKEYDVFLTLLGYEVRGKMRLISSDPRSLLCHSEGNFIPVPEGSVSYAGMPFEQEESQVVIANKTLVSTLHIEASQGNAGDIPATGIQHFRDTFVDVLQPRGDLR